MRFLRSICGRQTLLPRSLAIPLCCDLTGNPLCHGGFADVWKGRHQDLDVAAKVLKVYLSEGFGKVKRVGRLGPSRFVMCTNESTMSCVEVLQGGYHMEDP